MRLAELYELACIAAGVAAPVEAGAALARQACDRHGHAFREERCERCGLRLPASAVSAAEEDRSLREAREKSARVLRDPGSRKDTR